VTFHDAGHILGSSIVLIEVDGKRILFSGDLGRKNMPIIKDPAVLKDIDHLIIESTYGGRTHKDFEGMTAEFRKLIERGKKKESKIIIPAFAVERTQLLVTMLKNLYEEGTLKNVPVYVDSPLAASVTDVFRKHPECFDRETYKIFSDGDPFDFPGLIYVRTSDESKKLNARQGPMVIMSASGMCEGGRVTHHLIHSIENDDNMIVMTGFQARGTLGRALLEHAKTIRIFHDEYRVRAKVFFMGGLSAHADGDDLIEYIQNVRSERLQQVYLVHGDIEEATALKDSLTHDNGLSVTIPQSMTTVAI
jgi:metallo-beta-lactamase family protein